MTELERLLTAQFERMEQRHQEETRALREQLDAQQLALENLQTLLLNGLDGYETHCASLHSAFTALEQSTKSELASMAQSLDRTIKATGDALGSLNSSVNDLSEALDALQRAQR